MRYKKVVVFLLSLGIGISIYAALNEESALPIGFWLAALIIVLMEKEYDPRN